MSMTRGAARVKHYAAKGGCFSVEQPPFTARTKPDESG
jgi:hypothetical protein